MIFKIILISIKKNIEYLLTHNPEAIKKTFTQLDEQNPAYIESLDHLYNIYQSLDFQSLSEYTDQSSKQNVLLDNVFSFIQNIYLKFYYLTPQFSNLIKGISLLSQLYMKNDFGDKSEFHIRTKETIKNVKYIFSHIINQLFLIICLYDKGVYHQNSADFRKYIGFDPKKLLGKREAGDDCKLFKVIDQVAGQFDEQDTKEKVFPDQDETNQTSNEVENTDNTEEQTQKSQDEKEALAEEENNPILKTKEYKYGKSLMTQLIPTKLRAKHDASDNYSFLQDTDKVFLSFMYFQEFDQEYSFILTSKQIRYNPTYSHGIRIDYSKVLPDLYNESRIIFTTFEEYCTIQKDCKRHQEDKVLNSISHLKRENLLKAKLNSQAIVVRKEISKYISKVTTNLVSLIADLKEQKNVIENIEETIYLDRTVNSRKKLVGKKIKEGITEVYCYCLALKQRISFGGNLYGGDIHLTDAEMQKMYGSLYSTSNQVSQSHVVSPIR